MKSVPSTLIDHSDGTHQFHKLANTIVGERQALTKKYWKCKKIVTNIDAVVNFDLEPDVSRITLKSTLPIAVDLLKFFSLFELPEINPVDRPYYYDRRGTRYEWHNDSEVRWIKNGGLYMPSERGG